MGKREPTSHHRPSYDIWYVAKGIFVKMEALSKEKDSEVISEWMKSMVNHLYWSASSTPWGGGGVEQKLEGSDVTVQSYTKASLLHFQSVNTLACIGMLKEKSGLSLVSLHVEV